jgi:hypothetical protein
MSKAEASWREKAKALLQMHLESIGNTLSKSTESTDSIMLQLKRLNKVENQLQ